MKRAKKYGKNEWTDPESGEALVLRETKYIFGSVATENMEFDSYAVLALVSVKISEYKRWMSTILQFQMKAPLYAHPIRITTKNKKFPAGWAYVPIIKPVDGRGLRESMLPPEHELYQASRALKKLYDKGLVKQDFSKQDGDGDTEPGEGDGHPFG